MWRPTRRLSFFAHGWRLSQDGGENTECTLRLNEGGQLCPLLHRLFNMCPSADVESEVWGDYLQNTLDWVFSPLGLKGDGHFFPSRHEASLLSPQHSHPLRGPCHCRPESVGLYLGSASSMGHQSWARELGRLSPWPPYSSSFRSYVDPPGLLQVRSRRWGILCPFQRL